MFTAANEKSEEKSIRRMFKRDMQTFIQTTKQPHQYFEADVAFSGK